MTVSEGAAADQEVATAAAAADSAPRTRLQPALRRPRKAVR